MIEAVLFDMDGTLLDTEKIVMRDWAQVAKKSGFILTDEILAASRGLSLAESKKLIRNCFGERFDYDAIRDERIRLTEANFEKNGVPVKKGAYELLDALDALGIKKAVATSTDRFTAEKHLKMTGLLGRFDATVCGDEIECGKPAPDIFLKAARLLGAVPEHCMVAEDSAAGIRAAHAAGMLPVMIPDMYEPDELTKGLLYALCRDLTELIPLISQPALRT